MYSPACIQVQPSLGALLTLIESPQKGTYKLQRINPEYNTPSYHTMSKTTLEQHLLLLQQLLESLPPSLPEPSVSSYSFHLNAKDVEDLGYEGALNWMLENTLGLRVHGLKLRERGSGIVGVVQVLEEGILKCPKSAILEKWLDDLIASVQAAGAISEVLIILFGMH